MQFGFYRSIRYAFINLFLVSFIGVILRYKIAFSFPFIDQKHLLHAHSHFAFTGWISHALMVLLLFYLTSKSKQSLNKRYDALILANLISAYGMLISFTIQGYGFWSIGFSSFSIITSYLFSILYWKDLNKIPAFSISHLWFKMALICNALSSIGAFALAIMMATKNLEQNWYLIAVYFYLHFQYNGWFFFAGMGLLNTIVEQMPNIQKKLKIVFWLFSIACIPAFLLSTLWLQLPRILYLIVILAALAQFIGWIYFLLLLKKNSHFLNIYFPKNTSWLFVLSAMALTIKLCLQLGSTYPSLSQLAFGFRPIVIGYLHLVLLGVITIFLVGYILLISKHNYHKKVFLGVRIFVAGIIINETLLMTQGVAALDYIIVPKIDMMLFTAALIMCLGILYINLQIKHPARTIEPESNL